MASELKVDKIFNAGGDQDSGINLATNDTIKFDIATSTKATMASTGIVTIVGEGGTTTTNLQQGLAKVWFNIDQEPSTQTFRDSFNVASSSDEGTGATKLTFTNAFNNDGYSAAGMAKDDSGGSFGILRISSPMSTTQFQFMGESHDDTNVDCDVAAGSLHGDLA